MRQWISRFFLITGMCLLLFHNIVAHHHDDEHDKIHHHDYDALEHVKIDHIFFNQYANAGSLHAIIPDLVFKPEYSFIQFPVTLPNKLLILPDEPYPPGWVTDQTILRGPPSNC